MTNQRADQIAGLVLAAAAAGVVVAVVKTPPLRRMAWRLAGMTLTVQLPRWVQQEIGHAWRESSHRAL